MKSEATPMQTDLLKAPEVFVSQWQGPMYRLALSWLGHEADAADATQDIFVTLLRDRRRRPSARRLEGWVYTVAMNVLRQHLRRVKRRREKERARPTPAPSSAKDPSEAELESLVQRKVSELPDELRLIIVLRYFEEKSQSAIARLLSLPRTTIQTRLHQGLSRLRSSLKPCGAAALAPRLEQILRSAPKPPIPAELGPRILAVARVSPAWAPAPMAVLGAIAISIGLGVGVFAPGAEGAKLEATEDRASELAGAAEAKLDEGPGGGGEAEPSKPEPAKRAQEAREPKAPRVSLAARRRALATEKADLERRIAEGRALLAAAERSSAAQLSSLVKELFERAHRFEADTYANSDVDYWGPTRNAAEHLVFRIGERKAAFLEAFAAAYLGADEAERRIIDSYYEEIFIRPWMAMTGAEEHRRIHRGLDALVGSEGARGAVPLLAKGLIAVEGEDDAQLAAGLLALARSERRKKKRTDLLTGYMSLMPYLPEDDYRAAFELLRRDPKLVALLPGGIAYRTPMQKRLIKDLIEAEDPKLRRRGYYCFRASTIRSPEVRAVLNACLERENRPGARPGPPQGAERKAVFELLDAIFTCGGDETVPLLADYARRPWALERAGEDLTRLKRRLAAEKRNAAELAKKKEVK